MEIEGAVLNKYCNNVVGFYPFWVLFPLFLN